MRSEYPGTKRADPRTCSGDDIQEDQREACGEEAITEPEPRETFPEEFDTRAFWDYLSERFGADVVRDQLLLLATRDNDLPTAREVMEDLERRLESTLPRGEGLSTGAPPGLSRNIPRSPSPMPHHLDIPLTRGPTPPASPSPMESAPSGPERSDGLPIKVIQDIRDGSWKRRELVGDIARRHAKDAGI